MLSSRGRHRPKEVSRRPGSRDCARDSRAGSPSSRLGPAPCFFSKRAADRPLLSTRSCESRLRSGALGGARASAFPEAALSWTPSRGEHSLPLPGKSR